MSITKKSFYYNFYPSKVEEEAEEATRRPHLVTRILVEIRDLYPQSLDPNNRWPIRKFSTSSDILTGKLIMTFSDMFNHILRYWNMEMANYLIMGNRLSVELRDFTDENNPFRYRSECTFLERGIHDSYILGWMDVIRNRFVNPGDEIGLFWDTRSASVHLKLFRRGI